MEGIARHEEFFVNLDQIERFGRFSMLANRILGLTMAIPGGLFALVFAVSVADKLARRAQEGPHAYWLDPTGDVVAVLVAAVFVALGALVYLRGRNGKRHPVYGLLRDRPADVVWVTRVTALGTGRDRLEFFLDSGKPGGMLLVPTPQGAEVMVGLKGLLPHATFGISAEIAELYRRDPRLLRRQDPAKAA
jgi:hypothetical protein